MLYKITGMDGQSIHSGEFVYEKPSGNRPGKWTPKIERLRICEVGYHLVGVEQISKWLKVGILWEVESKGDVVNGGNKSVHQQIRLVRKVGVIDRMTLVRIANEFAKHVLPIYEKKYPGDKRVRKLIAATYKWCDDPSEVNLNKVKQARKDAADAAAYAGAAAADAAAAAYDAAAYAAAAYAADAGAYAAAYAADAAAYAATAAAYDAAAADAAAAAYAAAAYDAAAYAADAGAYDAAAANERLWQGKHILSVLSKQK